MIPILVLALLVFPFLAPLPGQPLPPLVQEMGYADLLLVNGKIVSMDDRSTVPETPGSIHPAMAVKGKRIMALGSEEQMRLLAGPATRRLDLGGRTVLPGLIQTHYHLFTSAGRRHGPRLGLTDPSIRIDVTGETTPEATAKKIREAVVNAIRSRGIPPGQWISVSLAEAPGNPPGTNRTWFYLSKLNRRQLDALTPDHPVVVAGRIGGYFNSVAIEEFKKVFPDWEESADFENGPGSAADGYAAVPEQGALTFEFWWRDKPLSLLAEALRLQGLDILEKGITTVATRLLYPRTIAALALLNREGRLPHRLAYYVESQRGNFFNLKTTREFYRGYGAPWTDHRHGGEMMWLNGMCNEIWGSTQNAVCLGPDLPADAEIKGRERCPYPGSKPWESLRAAILHGWRPVQVHGAGPHDARLYIRMLEETMREGNLSLAYMRGLRTTLEHNQLMGNLPDVVTGIRKFDILVNVNTGMLAEVPKLIGDYGEQLRGFAMPVKSWIDQGIRVTFEAMGLDFWTPIYTLVTRRTAPNAVYPESALLLPEEAIDRVTALKMGTTWASEYMLAQDTIGTLEPGKYADFAVLDRDFFTIPEDEIRDLQVVLTGLNGEVVYDPGGLAGDE